MWEMFFGYPVNKIYPWSAMSFLFYIQYNPVILVEENGIRIDHHLVHSRVCQMLMPGPALCLLLCLTQTPADLDIAAHYVLPNHTSS